MVPANADPITAIGTVEATLSDQDQARGFSFEIDESPSPGRVSSSRDDLDASDGFDLDFGDLGGEPAPSTSAPAPTSPPATRRPTLLDSVPPPAVEARQAPNSRPTPPLQAPPRQEPTLQATDPLQHAGAHLPEEASKAADGPAAADQAPAAHQRLEDVARALPAEARRKTTDRRPLARTLEAPKAEPRAEPKAEPKATPQTELARTQAASRPDEAKSTSGEQRLSRSAAAAPVVKKIAFPASKASKSAPEPPKTATRFSSSVGHRRPQLESSDAIDEALENNNELDAPEDLDLSRGETDQSAWAPETPTAAALWGKARQAWSQGSEKALEAGQKGLASSRRAAGGLSLALKERLEQQRRQSLEQELSSAQPPAAAPLSQEAKPRGHQPESSEEAATERKQAPSLVTRIGKAALKKTAAPLAAAAAALVVYTAGTHFLGSSDEVSLSSIKAADGPDVPNLGTIPSESADEAADASGDSKFTARSRKSGSGAPEEAEKEKSGPPPMATELVPMPEGLSWPGKGLLEVVTAEEELIYVDGVFTGRGPLRRVPVTPGEHEISIRKESSRREGTASVQMDKCTRAVFRVD